MKTIEEFLQEVDTLNDGLIQETAKRGRPVTCRGIGCYYCCYEPVYCSAAESRHLIQGLTPGQLVAVTHRWESAILLAKSSGLFAEERPSVFEWLKWKIACPLLEDGKCIAYDRRPAACRAHLAVGLPQKCEDDREHQLFAGSAKQSFGMSSAIISHHFGLGQPLVMDNLLALLSLDLIGERMETASALEVKVDP